MDRIINRQVGDDPSVPFIPPVYDPVIVHEANLTKSQLQQALRSQKRSSDFTCLLSEKKQIVSGILKHRDVLSTALQAVDSFNSRNPTTATMYQQQFNAALGTVTTTSITTANNVEVSDIMIALFQLFQSTVDHIKFRSLDKDIKEVVNRLTDKMDQLVLFIISECENKNESSKLLHGVPRNRQQLARAFLQEGGSFPRDEYLINCVFCGHATVDEPPENAEVHRINEERLAKHAKLTQDWIKYKDGKGTCPKTSQGKPFKRHPPPTKNRIPTTTVPLSSNDVCKSRLGYWINMFDRM